MPEPYSEEWWLRLDVRNALRKAVESVRTLEPTAKKVTDNGL